MTFDDILADCIEALEQGATIEECLTRYPAHATALEPLLRLVFSLSHESQTRLSSPAFQRGRQLLLAQAKQRQAHHRHPGYPPAPSLHQRQGAAYAQNGLPQRPRSPRRSATTKRAWSSMGLPTLLRTALLLMLLMGTTTFFREVMTSLPGTILYPIKNSGEELVGVLMKAAGEEVSWHATQTERRLEELAQLTQPDISTVQTLSAAVETHWEALLIASEELPVTEREALLQMRLMRLRQLETAWTMPQSGTPPPAVATVRKLITAGEEALSQPQQPDNPMEVVNTVTPTVTATLSPTVSPTVSPTPLLQASATASITHPILVPSPTPIASPTLVSTLVDLATPTVELPTPTEPISMPPATPLPEITAQMPQQESGNQDEDEDHNDSEEGAETATATTTPTTEPPTAVTPLSPTETMTPGPEDGTATTEPTVATPTEAPPLPPPPTITEVQPTPVPSNATAQATVPVENTPAVPTKTAPSATSTAGPTAESAATATARPTSQATATKTPKPTATHANAATATPDTSDNATAAPPTAMENTPSATTQPTTAPRDEAIQTPGAVSVTPVFAQPVKPRPTTPGGEPTKAVQP